MNKERRAGRQAGGWAHIQLLARRVERHQVAPHGFAVGLVRVTSGDGCVQVVAAGAISRAVPSVTVCRKA
jgi:ammonia channel protein AmtB